MEERHGRSLRTYPRRSWRSVCLPCSPGRGWFLSHVTEPGGILCHSGVHCLREHDFVRGGHFREGIAQTRIQAPGFDPLFETKGLGCHSIVGWGAAAFLSFSAFPPLLLTTSALQRLRLPSGA